MNDAYKDKVSQSKLTGRGVSKEPHELQNFLLQLQKQAKGKPKTVLDPGEISQKGRDGNYGDRCEFDEHLCASVASKIALSSLIASFHEFENQDLERGDNIFEGIRLERAGPGFCVAFIIQSKRIQYDISGVSVDCGHIQSLKFFLTPFLHTGISFSQYKFYNVLFKK